MSLAKAQIGLVCILLAPAAQAQIEPTWMDRRIVVSASRDCGNSERSDANSESGPWEQGLSFATTCVEGSVYALGSQRSNIAESGLSASGTLSAGMHGIRVLDSYFLLRDDYRVRFDVREAGYYRVLANIGARHSPKTPYSVANLNHARASVTLFKFGVSYLLICEAEARPGEYGEQSISQQRLLFLEPGQYQADASNWIAGEVISLAPDHWSAQLRYDFSLKPVACPADVNGDSQVDAADLTLLLSHMGDYALNAPERADIDGSLWVDAEDLAILLSFFGQVCD